MEAINKFYLNNEKIEDVNEFNEDSEKGSIIYEVLRVINGKAVFLKDHIERMKRSFALINMEFPFNTEDVEKKVNEVIKKNDNVLGNIKITYNTASKNLKIYYIKHSYPSNELYTEGVKTILYYGERENPNAFEAILVDRNGLITEGSKSNIFAIKDGKLITAKAEAVLKGITRDKIIDIAKEIGIEFEEVYIKSEDIDKLDAMFISGTSPKILPIAFVNNIKLDVNNITLRKIMKAYNELLEGKR